MSSFPGLRLAVRSILFWLILSAGAAFFWPATGFSFDPFMAAGSQAINVLIVITMFGVGALLPIDEVNQVFRNWPHILLGSAIQYLSMPALAWAIVQVLQPTTEIATGILIVGCVPGAMASNVLTLTARGNVSYSVSLTTSATLLSPLVVPAALWLTLDSDVNYDGWAAVRLLVFQIVLPVVLGHLLSRCQLRFRRLAGRIGSPVANTSVLAIIAIAVALNRSGVQQASLWLLFALGLMNAGGYLAGYFGAAAFRLPEPMRRALTLEVGMQNAGAGIALAKQLFGAESAAVLPCILYTFGCMLTGTVLATVWQRLTHVRENEALTFRSDEPQHR
ncbi:MAG: bile acid:sodium symporter family protein [Fuerstiella sp.]